MSGATTKLIFSSATFGGYELIINISDFKPPVKDGIIFFAKIHLVTFLENSNLVNLASKARDTVFCIHSDITHDIIYICDGCGGEKDSNHKTLGEEAV